MTRKIPTLITTALALLLPASAFASFHLVREGKPACTIVLPENPGALEKEGAETLVKYLEMATGATIPVIREPASAPGAILSFGRTSLAREEGITDRDLEHDGYRMVARNGTLFLLGRDQEIMAAPVGHGDRLGAQGSRRVALDLLQLIGFRWLVPTVAGTHVPELENVSVPGDLDVTHRPPFMYVAGRMYTWGDWSIANSFRKALRIFSSGGHTWNEAVPVSLWEEHPEYFRMQGRVRVRPTAADHQLCPSNPGVLQRITDYTLELFERGFDLVSLGQPDGWKPCECGPCQALGAGTDANRGESAEQVHITNLRVIEACLERYPDRLVHPIIYGPTQSPPLTFEAYPPNVMVELAPPTPGNLAFWSRRTPAGMTVYVYYMGLYQNTGMLPRFTPSMAAREMRMLHENGVKGIYFCGGGEKWGTEGPTYYALGRLAGNPYLDWRAILDEYCRLLFGKAGLTMRQYYELLYERIDNYYFEGGSPTDAVTAVYTPEVLERLSQLLYLARGQAAGDERALGFIRVAEIANRHYTLIARTLHLYQAYQVRPTREALEHMSEAAAEYLRFVNEEIPGVLDAEPEFGRRYFAWSHLWRPEHRIARGTFANNFGRLSSPFSWNFENLFRHGVLPGSERARAVFHRLETAPAIDGNLDDPAWAGVPWVEVREVALGDAEASTRMKLGYDDENLYFAFECREPLIDEMVVTRYDRDGRVFNTECIEIFLAPDGVGQKRVQLVISPTETGIWDGRYGYIEDPLHPLNLSGRADVSWDPEYTHAYRVDREAELWTIEVAFPFSELDVPVPAAGERWRGNFGRERHKWVWNEEKYPGRSEWFLWAPNLQGTGFPDPAAYGDLFFGQVPGTEASR